MEYLHPSVSSTITDNSQVFQTADGNTALLAIGAFERGEDSVLNLVTTDSEFLFKYGNPSLSKYGQTSYNVLNWLRSGGKAFVLRVLPSNATYHNTLIKFKTAAGSEPTKTKFLFSTVTAESTSISSIGAMKTVLTTETPNEIPLGFIIPKGRGLAYKGYGWRLSLRSDLDETYEFRTYDFSVTIKDSTGSDTVVEGPYLVSFDPEAKNKNRESIYWTSVINKYSTQVSVVDNRAAFDKIAEYIIGDSEDINPANIDIFFGRERSVKPAQTIHSGVKWKLSTVEDDDPLYEATAANYSKVQVMDNGIDGTWTGQNTEEALITRGYNGLIDPSVLDKKAWEVDMVLDANYPAPVKQAISDLAEKQRGDFVAMLDLGFQANEQQTLQYRQDTVSMSTYFTSIFAHDMEVYDQYNGETIKVTTPYLLASKIPTNDRENGMQWTFVGPRRGVISGFEKLNFVPNEIWKENLYKAQINYIEKDPKKTNLATQLTSQTINSALSNINNVRVLLRIRREVEAMMSDYRMEFNDAFTYDSMNYNLNNYLQKWVANRACTTISGSVYASEYDRQNKLARVKIDIVFNNVMERIAINLVVNR